MAIQSTNTAGSRPIGSPGSMSRAQRKRREAADGAAFRIGNNVFLVLLVITMFIPVWSTFVVSVSGNIASMQTGIRLWPADFSLEGYSTVWERVELWRPFLYNILVTLVSTFGQVLLCAMGGYVLLQRELPGRRLIMTFVLVTMMIPNEAIMIPLYIVNKELHLINTLASLMLYTIVSGFSIVLARNYFLAVPHELAESARLDGAGELRIFATIFMPLARPGLATVALFELVNRWNQFTPALLFITNKKLYTLQIALRSLVIETDSTSSNLFMTPNVRMAGVMIALLPLVAIYPFVQRYFVQGLMVGATKE